MSDRLSVVAVVVSVAACGGGGGTADAPPPVIDAPAQIDAAPLPPGEDFDIPTTINRDIDLLFVIDDSGSMLEEQDALRASFPTFINVLEQTEGGLPNVHIGVVTSDMGTLNVSTGDAACSDSDRGNLVKGNPDLTNQCPEITGNYISDIDTGAGRIANYTGTLADAFACAAAVGQNGCGFEQHLASARAALDNNPVNATFLRPTASLALIVLADEDDCSAADPAFFAPENPTIGPLDSFRCFEKAVACDQGSDVALRDEGVKTGCVPDDTQDYLHDVGEYVTFFKGLKPNPRDVVVAGIIGNSEPVEVGRRTPTGSTTPRPDLHPSCSYTDGLGNTNEADPGIRLKAFFDSFPDRNTYRTICSDDYIDALIAIAEQLRRLTGYACVQSADLADADGNPGNGLQPDCTFAFVTDPGEPTESVQPLPACDGGLTNQPCWHLVVDPVGCGETPTQLSVVVERTIAPPPNTHIIGRCRIN